MDLSNKNLMTTKEAGLLSGYTADYLSRLVRSGEISGERTGHTWLIDRASLELFLKEKKIQKTERARKLSDARSIEYHQRREIPSYSFEAPTRRVALQQSDLGHVSLRSRALALSVATTVVVLGAMGARTSIVPLLGNSIAVTAQEASTGFIEAFGDLPFYAASNVASAYSSLHADTSYSRLLSSASEDAYRVPPLLVRLPKSPTQMNFVRRYQPSSVLVSSGISIFHATELSGVIENIQSPILDFYSFLTTPTLIKDACIHAYTGVGIAVYKTIIDAFTIYDSSIEHLGAGALAFATATHEFLPTISGFIGHVDLAFGQTLIDAAHLAIHTDVAASYALAGAAPLSARTAVLFMGSIGDALENSTAKVPSQVAATYLQTTAIPVTLAPMLAEKVYGLEYILSGYFVASLDMISHQYLALVEGMGRMVYAGTAGALSLLNIGPSALANIFSGSTQSATFRLSTW